MHVSVGVVIPMFNSEKTIARALASVAQQSYQPNRIVIVDDGSNDKSCDVVKTFILENTNLNIELIFQENSGPAIARNTGVACCEEKLIAFLDADDEWYEDKLKIQVDLYNKLSEENIKVGLIECFMKDISSQKTVVASKIILAGDSFELFLTRNAVKGTPCVLMERDVFNEFGGFCSKLRFSEDRLLWSKVASKYGVYTIDKVLVNRYFGEEGNITSNPERNYFYKKEFMKIFLSQFRYKLNEKQIYLFQISNMDELITAGYAMRKHKFVVKCYLDMLSISRKSFFYGNMYPTLKAIVSFASLLFLKLRC